MRKQCIGNTLILILVFSLDSGFAQDKKIDKFRVGGGSASATQMSLWLAKEGNYYEKNGLSVEAISIPGSSLALQAMLAGEVPIIQLGGGAPLAATFSAAGRDITMGQAGGPSETVTAMVAGKVQAAAISPPATLQARKLKLKEILDLSKLDVEYHVNGVVTSRSYLKSHEDTVRRFLRAYIEGAARGQKDKAFAMKAMGKYFRTDDKEVLEETYESVIKAFSIPPYPSIRGIANLLQDLEKQNPKARGAKPEDFADSRFVRELDQTGFIKSILDR